MILMGYRLGKEAMKALNVDANSADHVYGTESAQSSARQGGRMERLGFTHPNARDAGMPNVGSVMSDRLSAKTPDRTNAEPSVSGVAAYIQNELACQEKDEANDELKILGHSWMIWATFGRFPDREKLRRRHGGCLRSQGSIRLCSGVV